LNYPAAAKDKGGFGDRSTNSGGERKERKKKMRDTQSGQDLQRLNTSIDERKKGVDLIRREIDRHHTEERERGAERKPMWNTDLM